MENSLNCANLEKNWRKLHKMLIFFRFKDKTKNIHQFLSLEGQIELKMINATNKINCCLISFCRVYFLYVLYWVWDHSVINHRSRLYTRKFLNITSFIIFHHALPGICLLVLSNLYWYTLTILVKNITCGTPNKI